MNVNELIAELKKYPGDLPVYDGNDENASTLHYPLRAEDIRVTKVRAFKGGDEEKSAGVADSWSASHRETDPILRSMKFAFHAEEFDVLLIG